jgi:hypothetical protein
VGATGDAEHEAVGGIEADQRGVALAPVGDGVGSAASSPAATARAGNIARASASGMPSRRQRRLNRL